MKKKKTKDAVKILHNRYVTTKAKKESLSEERVKTSIASKLYEMRKAAGLTQQELADLVGTTQSVISRIEDSDYDNYNLETIRKIAEALHYGVRIEFIPENELVRN